MQLCYVSEIVFFMICQGAGILPTILTMGALVHPGHKSLSWLRENERQVAF